jgi:hypothetical protein
MGEIYARLVGPKAGDRHRKTAMQQTANSPAKPVTIRVRAASVPASMKATGRWVCWRWECRDADWTKVPIDPKTGRRAKSNDPGTWGSFDAACRRYERRCESGAIDGIGFMLGDGWCGVDADRCIGDGGEVSPMAAEIVQRFDTYAEVSPRGRGLKLIGFGVGDLPRGCGAKDSKLGLEVYSRGRFFTVTGRVFHGTEPVVVTEAIRWLYDKWLPHKKQRAEVTPPSPTPPVDRSDDEVVRKVTQPAKYASLWQGEIPAGKSRSEADLSLCNRIAFFVGNDPDRLDRIFRLSSLGQREKWLQRADYRERTITRAIAGQRTFYRWGARITTTGGPSNGKCHAHAAVGPACDAVPATGGGTPHSAHQRGDAFEPPPPPAADGGDGRGPVARVVCFRNFDEQVIVNDSKTQTRQVGLPLPEMGRRLGALTGGWPKRVGPMLFAEGADRSPLWLEDADELLAWVSRYLPANGPNSLQFARGADKPTAPQLVAFCRQTVENFRAVEAYPHEPRLPEHYYLHPGLEGGDGGTLDRLLDRFSPASREDRELIRAFFVTLAWGGPPGQRPGFLFLAPDDDPRGGRGVGKSAVAQAGGQLFGGLLDAGSRDDFEKIKTRLLSPAGRTKRLVVLDNLKTLRLSDEELEKLITGTLISGHAMYYGEGDRPNTLTVALTINGASLSKDMSQRCIPIVVRRPEYSATWREETDALIERERWAIIGDLVAFFGRPVKPLGAYSRWATWERDILGRMPDGDALLKLISERQERVDIDEEESRQVRDALAAVLKDNSYPPEKGPYFIPTADLGPILCDILGERIPINKVTGRLKTFTISELRMAKFDNGAVRGWSWSGPQAAGAMRMISLRYTPKSSRRNAGW